MTTQDRPRPNVDDFLPLRRVASELRFPFALLMKWSCSGAKLPSGEVVRLAPIFRAENGWLWASTEATRAWLDRYRDELREVLERELDNDRRQAVEFL